MNTNIKRTGDPEMYHLAGTILQAACQKMCHHY